MNRWNIAMAMLAVVPAAIAAPSVPDAAAVANHVQERMRADGVLAPDSRRGKEFAEHVQAVCEGRETLRDFAWLPTLVYQYRNESQRLPMALVRELLSAGADVSAEDFCGATALHRAAEQGNAAACELLAAAGANLEARVAAGFTPLALAVMSSSSDVVDVLLKAGAHVNTRCDAEPILFLPLKCLRGDEMKSMLCKLIAAGADVNARARGSGFNLLHTAAEFLAGEDVAVAFRMAVEAGVDINATDALGRTPLLVAKLNHRVDMMTLLLAAGADANAGRGGGAVLLEDCVRHGEFAPVVEMLLQAGVRPASESAIFNRLVAEANFDMCHSLVDIDAKPQDWPPLCLAALLGKTEEVQALLAAGADVNATYCGHTPLVYAAYAGQAETCRALLAAGADVNAAAQHPNCTPFAAAVGTGRVEVARLLLEAGATLPRDEACIRMPLLSYAAAMGHAELCRLLLAAGAEVNEASTFLKITPLMWTLTSETCNEEVVRLLLAAGAEVNAPCEEGNTPLHFLLNARRDLSLESPLCRLLIEAGADVTRKNKEGYTPAEICEHPFPRTCLGAFSLPMYHL